MALLGFFLLFIYLVYFGHGLSLCLYKQISESFTQQIHSNTLIQQENANASCSEMMNGLFFFSPFGTIFTVNVKVIGNFVSKM